MGYNQAKHTMALRSIYVFDNEEDFEAAKSALDYHFGGFSESTGVYWNAWKEISIYDECPDIYKAASICREHGGKYRNP